MHIQASTLSFLSVLKANNNREWLSTHKAEYDAAQSNLKSTVGLLLKGICEFDQELVGLEPKSCVFRIFRDVRFGHDKSPYKTHLGAWMAKGGRKSPFAGYYIHLQPGNGSFLAGGCYQPEPKVLHSIREAVDVEDEEFLALVQETEFRELFGGLGGERLQKIPKGYAKNHPMIEYLKHKSFVVTRPLGDDVLTAEGFLEEALRAYRGMHGLNQFLNRAIEHGLSD